MAGKDRILILGPTGRLLIEVQLKINVAIKKAGNVKVRYIRVSNETSYGVMEFVHAWKVEVFTRYGSGVRCPVNGRLEVQTGKQTYPGLLDGFWLLTILPSMIVMSDQRLEREVYTHRFKDHRMKMMHPLEIHV
ncbi:hypothetical protein JHK85_051102 [Glycine max]|nr:hypothetical protein JHK85_051102 [Glycine max]